MINQFKKEVIKDENYEYVITTLYEIFIKALDEDNIDTSKIKNELFEFKTKELPIHFTTQQPSGYLPTYKNYNLNTKYGRKKAREQSVANYNNGSPEYKQEIDKIRIVFWLIIFAIAIAIFFIKIALS